MKNYIQPGNILTFVASATVASGEGLLLGAGGGFGVNSYAVVSGENGEAAIEGVFELPKNSTDTPAAFAAAYWDNTNKRLTTTASGNTKVGMFTKAYGNGDVLAAVKLLPSV